jgi:L-histidine Nalpha-methyltransferase
MFQRAKDFSGARQVDPSFRQDVLAGLSRRPRSIPARWFYDRAGSELFEAITQLPEYYLARAERSLLSAVAGEVGCLSGPGRAVVEFGSGSSAKTSILLSRMSAGAYLPIDISEDFLRESAKKLSDEFPLLPVYPIEHDFTEPLCLPPRFEAMPRLGFFPGSTIGNFVVPEAVDLLRSMAKTLGPSSLLLVGIDRIKRVSTLLPAYDDSQGVTAAFNLNLLHRINRELMGSIPVDAFSHYVLWNDAEARIEMHLQARRDATFEIDGKEFSIVKSETIHTENSLKYGSSDANVLLRAGGWNPIANWTDKGELVSLILAARAEE